MSEPGALRTPRLRLTLVRGSTLTEGSCSTDGCERQVFVKGICRSCYDRQWAANRTPEQKAAANRKRQAWRTENATKVRDAQRRWYEANRDEVLRRRRIVAADRREERNAANRAEYATDPEKGRAAQRRFREANPNYYRDWARRRLKEDPERVRANNRRYYHNRPDHTAAREASKRWQKEHPEAGVARAQRRRARKLAAGGNLSSSEWRDILAAADGCCFYCGEHVDKLEQEHMTPLARGGRHDKENVVAACGPCNRKKGTMTAEEFRSR